MLSEKIERVVINDVNNKEKMQNTKKKLYLLLRKSIIDKVVRRFMIRNLAEKIVAYYPCDWTCNERIKETCICSVDNFISLIINLVVVIFFAVISSSELACLVFFLTNGMIRCYSGGIHASSHIKCLVVYLVIMFSSIFLAEVLNENANSFILLSVSVPIGCFFVNYKFGGMQKELDSEDSIKYNKRTIILTLFFGGILFLAGLIDIVLHGAIVEKYRYYLLIECFAMLVQSFSLLLEKKLCEK